MLLQARALSSLLVGLYHKLSWWTILIIPRPAFITLTPAGFSTPSARPCYPVIPLRPWSFPHSHLPTLVEYNISNFEPMIQSRYISLQSVPRRLSVSAKPSATRHRSSPYLSLSPRLQPSPQAVNLIPPQTPRKREVLPPPHHDIYTSPNLCRPRRVLLCAAVLVIPAITTSQWHLQYKYPPRVACSTHVSPNLLLSPSS